MDKLYANREVLTCIFRYFDTDCSGAISKEEFDIGVKTLNKRTSKYNIPLPDSDHLWGMLDIDGNNEVDINEFLEAFRVVDTKSPEQPTKKKSRGRRGGRGRR